MPAFRDTFHYDANQPFSIIAIGMTVSQLIVAVLGTTTTAQDSEGNIIVKNLGAQKASIAFVCIYIFFFASTWVSLRPHYFTNT